MNNEVLFIIYSCKKKLNISEQLYDMLNNNLLNCKVYLMYGDNSIDTEYKIIDNKYLILNVSDYYENLNSKTTCLFRVIESIFPNVRGVFKCDDDIIPSIQEINHYIDFFLKTNINYAGNIQVHNDHESYFHIGKSNDKRFDETPTFIAKSAYAAGPLYYLSKTAIILFNRSDRKLNLFNEDNMVGYYLNQSNIVGENYNLYVDNFKFGVAKNYQNTNNQTKKIYTKIHGGLGNQLFQIAAAYGMAKKYNKILIIVSDDTTIYSLLHNSYLNVYIDTIFKGKDLRFIYNENKIDNSIVRYSDANTIDCYSYNEDLIEPSKNEDIFLKGYFQNEKYFEHCKNDIIRLFKNEKIMNDLLIKYTKTKESFFIHYRRGDFVKYFYDLYNLDHDKYFTDAYKILNERNKEAHYYILSDDITYCKQYPIFNNIYNKTFIEETVLNSLYIMALCEYGGICSNSSFSWWGSYLNENPEKIVICPKRWINNGRYGKENDIYYDNTLLIDC
jgi:hypothetical protein